MFIPFAGIGAGFQFVPAILVPQMWFERKRALIIAITFSGCPLGSFIFCPIFQILINTFGWRGAILITGAMVLHGCAFSIILVPPKILQEKKPSDAPDAQKKLDMGSAMLYSVEGINDPTIVSTEMNMYQQLLKKLKTLYDASVLKSSLLHIVSLQWMLFTFGFPVLFTFLPIVAQSYGTNEETVSYMLSAFGFSEFSGRIVYGIIGSSKRVNSVYLLVCSSTASGVGYILLTWSKPEPIMFIFILVIGFNTGLFT